MSIEIIWLILTFCIFVVIVCYSFCKIVGDGKKLYRALAGFIWVILCGAWFGLFAYFVASRL